MSKTTLDSFIQSQIQCLEKYLRERELAEPNKTIKARLLNTEFCQGLGWLARFQIESADEHVRKGEWLITETKERGIISDVENNKFTLCTNKVWNELKVEVSIFTKSAPSEWYLVQAMSDIANYQGSQRRLRDILLKERKANIPGKCPKIKTFNHCLDKSQKQAVNLALNSHFIFLHGPPGSGKTKTLVEVVLQSIKKGTKVLVLAPTHAATDNVMGQVLEAGHTNVIRLGHPASSIYPRFTLENLLIEKDGQESVILYQACVVFSTLAGCLKKVSSMKQNHFGLTIVDEAGQSLEALIWTVVKFSTKLLLAGDFQQLGPTVISTDEFVKQILGRSMIQRIWNWGIGPIKMLQTQYRMANPIAQWPNQYFYEGKLQTAPTVAHINVASLPRVMTSRLPTLRNLLLVDTNGTQKEVCVNDGQHSCIHNPQEAASVVKLAKQLVRSGVQSDMLGIIGFYSKQISTIESLLKTTTVGKVEVKTIDCFQGREKDIILLSMVRSNSDKNIGFLKDIRRLNVAVTRAKRLLIIVVDTSTFVKEGAFRSFFEYIELNGDIKTFGWKK